MLSCQALESDPSLCPDKKRRDSVQDDKRASLYGEEKRNGQLPILNYPFLDLGLNLDLPFSTSTLIYRSTTFFVSKIPGACKR